MEALVEVPDAIVLEPLRGAGPQPGEQLQPEDEAGGAAPAGAAPVAAAPASAPAPAAPSPEVMSALEGMGFGPHAAARAAVAVGGAAGVEAAMEWLLGHLDDADINDPLPGGAYVA